MFVAKKVESTTFGAKLKKAREDAGLSKEKVAQNLNIRVKYLENLENNEIEKMPAEVYTRGFLKKYAKMLDLNENELVANYDKEIKIIKHLNKHDAHQSLPQLRWSPWALTPKTLSAIIFTLVFLLVISYISYQLYFLLRPPKLEVFDPSKDIFIENVDFKIIGQTDPGSKVSINGQEITITGDGKFERQISLGKGLNTINIDSMNRFGKKNTVTRQIMVK